MKKISLVVSLFVSSVFAMQIDVKKSIVSWKGTKITGALHEGRLPVKKAVVNQKKGGHWGEVELDLANFTVTDIKGESAEKFLGHMKSADFFNTKKYPTAKLKINSVKGYEATGDLTIMGKTQKVNFPLIKFSNKYVGKVTFDRTKFGMTYGSGNFFKNLGDKVINDEVEVDFEMFYTK